MAVTAAQGAPSPRRVALVLNRKAKRGASVPLERFAALVGEGNVYASDTLEEAELHARQIAQGGYDVVACGGGDGTLVGAINRLRTVLGPDQELPPLAFVALGTGNAVAHLVGAGDPETNLRHLCRAPQLAMREVPLLLDDAGHAFLFGGLGWDSLLLRDYERLLRRYKWPWLRSWRGYVVALLTKTLPHVWRERPLFHVRIDSLTDAWRCDPLQNDAQVATAPDVPLFKGGANFVAISAIPHLGYGLRAFPFADDSRGRVHLRVTSMGPLQALSRFSALWRGTLRDPDHLFDFLVRRVRIELDAPFAFQHSGDAHSLARTIVLEVAKQPLHLVRYP